MSKSHLAVFLAFLFALFAAGLARGAGEEGVGSALLEGPPVDLEFSAGPDVKSKTIQPALVKSTHPQPIYDTDPDVQAMMSEVISSTVVAYNGGLSGEWPVIVAGQPYTIETRHTYSGEPIQMATQYVGDHMVDLGLDVQYHEWEGETYPNVIGQLTGEIYPEEIMMITAHLDSTSNKSSTDAPGADDNASGSTAVLIAADILSQYTWDCTLRFAFWTGEEQGLRGSHAYAERAFGQDEIIRGVLNLDMIAWNSAGSEPGIDLHSSKSVPGSIFLAETFSHVVNQYDLNLAPEIIPNGTNLSDHASFWKYGFPAMLAIEDRSDFNPYYHSTNDRLPNLDIEYFTEFVRAAVGTFALMGDCDEFPPIPIIYLPVAVKVD